MKRKIKLKHKLIIKKKKIDFISISFFIILFVIFWFFLLNKEASPILFNYDYLETKKLSTIIINKAVSNQASQEMTLDKIVKTTLNKNKEIVSVDFDPMNVNKSLNSITNTVGLNLKLLESGKLELIDIPELNNKELKKVEKDNGIIYEIPFGVIFRNPILEDIGPKIPVKTKMIGSVESNIETKITNYGINNALLEVFIRVKVSEQVILPFVSKRVTISQNIPVAIKIIQGTVPKYYGTSMNDQSSILSIPIENEN